MKLKSVNAWVDKTGISCSWSFHSRPYLDGNVAECNLVILSYVGFLMQIQQLQYYAAVDIWWWLSLSEKTVHEI